MTPALISDESVCKYKGHGSLSDLKGRERKKKKMSKETEVELEKTEEEKSQRKRREITFFLNE